MYTKKIYAVLLAAALAATMFAGCGKGSDDSAKDTKQHRWMHWKRQWRVISSGEVSIRKYWMRDLHTMKSGHMDRRTVRLLEVRTVW